MRRVEKEMTSLWRMMADEKVPDKLLHTLIPRHSRCVELPKDHKPRIPLRPIVSPCDTPCERVSWLIERILHQLLQFVPSHLSNTQDFINRLHGTFPEGKVAYRIFSWRGEISRMTYFVRVCICDAATRILVNNYFLEVQWVKCE
jgi:hypothetical protein